jgi:hypothetical protein
MKTGPWGLGLHNGLSYLTSASPFNLIGGATNRSPLPHLTSLLMKRSLHPLASPRKPVGQPTRGKTAANRLRRVDNFALRYDPALLRRQDGPFAHALFVDLGYGAEPTTTLESAARFRRLNPWLPVLGVEIDPQRVAAAQPHADTLTNFRLGGFNLPLLPTESVRLIRAFNVLRQYEEAEVGPAYERLEKYVLPGGLMLEGTSDPFGRLWVANLVRRRQEAGWEWEALVFSTNFRSGFEPSDFQAVLPKNLIHHMIPGEPIHEFFEAWKRAAAFASPARAWGLRQWFVASAERLALAGFDINLQQKWLGQGWLIWRRPPQRETTRSALV